MQKRTALKIAIAGALSAMLSACGKEEQKAAPAQTSAAKPAAGEAKAAQEPLKVAFVYVSPANEEGWSSQHDLGRKAVEAKFGDRIKVTTLENIPENADAERVIRDLAQQGNKLIFATSFGYMNSVMKVAKEFPDVKFEHATGYMSAENVLNYTARFYEPRYLAGMLAGATTKTNQIGYVAALPIPEVLQGINAFTLGVRRVNPKAEVRVVWTSAWYDPGKESDATKSLIGQQCDVITHHTNSTAVASTCEAAKIPVISYNSAMKKAAPTMLLAGVVHLWDAYYTKRIQAVLDGTWKPENVWGGAPEQMVDLIEISKDAPKETVDQIHAVFKEMQERKFHPFMGPVKTNEGKEVIPAGRAATDKELLEMNWFVEGVAGKVPSAQ